MKFRKEIADAGKSAGAGRQPSRGDDIFSSPRHVQRSATFARNAFVGDRCLHTTTTASTAPRAMSLQVERMEEPRW